MGLQEGLIYFFNCFAKGLKIKTFVWKQTLKTLIASQHVFSTFIIFTDSLKPLGAVSRQCDVQLINAEVMYACIQHVISPIVRSQIPSFTAVLC